MNEHPADVRAREAMRDQFAAAALTGLLAAHADNGAREIIAKAAKQAGVTAADFVVDTAYTYADAMVARRAQPTASAPAPAPTAP